MQKAFPRSIDSLTAVFEFTAAFFSAQDIDAGHRFAVDLAVEELFTNMVRHGAGSDGDIVLSLDRTDDRLTIRLTDPDSDFFDPTAAADPDVNLPLEQRRPGGLGVFLTKKVMDGIDYEYSDRTSTITMTKRLG